MVPPKKKIGVVMFASSENRLAIAKPIIEDAMETDALPFKWLKYGSK